MYTKAQIERLINNVYGGAITPRALPIDLYNDINNNLVNSVVTGFGIGFAANTISSDLFNHFKHNVGVFSAGKTHSQVNAMSKEIFSKKGVKVPFGKFQEKAKEIFGQYNKNWLRVEQDTAVSQAQSARRWQDIQEDKEILPLLQFVTVGDERVRDSHANLNGVTKPVDDPFWDNFYPPIEWNCRCTVIQLSEGEAPVTKKPPTPEIPKLFQNNPGKDKMIFDLKKHPYLKVEDRFKSLKARNFGLPVPPKPKPLPKPTFKPMTKRQAGILARQQLKKAAAQDVAITTDIKTAATAHNAKLEGLAHRLKGEGSTTRKILKENIETKYGPLTIKREDMGDLNRYTMIISETNYTKSVRNILADFEAKGYKVTKVKNYWATDNYKGINTNMLSPKGQKMELQFHTPRSIHIKETVSHPLYEEFRLTTISIERKEEIKILMKQGWESVKLPKGVTTIATEINTKKLPKGWDIFL